MTQPRFLADVMLGTLAKWLRVLGYDTEYDNSIEDDAVVQRCVNEDRIALTSDSRLVQRRLLRDRHVLVSSHKLSEQLIQVVAGLENPPDSELRLTRCLECNSLIKEVSKSEVRALVPSYVFETQEEFRRCPDCKRVYWRGTHRERMIEKVLSLYTSAPGTPG
jgi:uncharacterized protein with PIN domain